MGCGTSTKRLSGREAYRLEDPPPLVETTSTEAAPTERAGVAAIVVATKPGADDDDAASQASEFGFASADNACRTQSSGTPRLGEPKPLSVRLPLLRAVGRGKLHPDSCAASTAIQEDDQPPLSFRSLLHDPAAVARVTGKALYDVPNPSHEASLSFRGEQPDPCPEAPRSEAHPAGAKQHGEAIVRDDKMSQLLDDMLLEDDATSRGKVDRLVAIREVDSTRGLVLETEAMPDAMLRSPLQAPGAGKDSSLDLDSELEELFSFSPQAGAEALAEAPEWGGEQGQEAPEGGGEQGQERAQRATASCARQEELELADELLPPDVDEFRRYYQLKEDEQMVDSWMTADGDASWEDLLGSEFQGELFEHTQLLAELDNLNPEEAHKHELRVVLEGETEVRPYGIKHRSEDPMLITIGVRVRALELWNRWTSASSAVEIFGVYHSLPALGPFFVAQQASQDDRCKGGEEGTKAVVEIEPTESGGIGWQIVGVNWEPLMSPANLRVANLMSFQVRPGALNANPSDAMACAEMRVRPLQ
eukprot:gene1732-2392_t